MDLADLLTLGKKYLRDAMPGGVLNPEVTRQSVLDGAAIASSPVPVLGDLLGLGADVNRYATDPASRTAGNYALSAFGALPFMPSLAGMIRTPVGRIPENAVDARSLADMLQRAGERAGYYVQRSDSAISPSKYVAFSKHDDEVGDTVRQVRISNHADKYPELANGIRTSVDPSTEVSFEQAVNWLAREGFPTTLSKKYKDIPTWEQYYAARRAADATPEVRLQKLRDAWLNQPKATRGPRPTIDDVK